MQNSENSRAENRIFFLQRVYSVLQRCKNFLINTLMYFGGSNIFFFVFSIHIYFFNYFIFLFFDNEWMVYYQ